MNITKLTVYFRNCCLLSSICVFVCACVCICVCVKGCMCFISLTRTPVTSVWGPTAVSSHHISD